MGDQQNPKVVKFPRAKASSEGRLAEIRQTLREAEDLPQTTSRSQAEWDKQVIEDEQAFITRFGFDWSPRHHVALIRLKHELDLTDREINCPS